MRHANKHALNDNAYSKGETRLSYAETSFHPWTVLSGSAQSLIGLGLQSKLGRVENMKRSDGCWKVVILCEVSVYLENHYVTGGRLQLSHVVNDGLSWSDVLSPLSTQPSHPFTTTGRTRCMRRVTPSKDSVDLNIGRDKTTGHWLLLGRDKTTGHWLLLGRDKTTGHWLLLGREREVQRLG